MGDGLADAGQGVLNLSLSGGMLGVDLSDARWSLVSAGVTPQSFLVKAVYEASAMESFLRAATRTLWDDDTVNAVDRVLFALGNAGGSYAISEKPVANNKATLFLCGDAQDLFAAGAGRDLSIGDRGDDGLIGGLGVDALWGGNGNDTMIGNNGEDSLYGGYGDDYMLGGTGADRLEGGEGNDGVFGDEEDDTLYGGDGNDLLYGQAGLDVLYGQADADRFVFQSASAFDPLDWVMDFSASEGDILDLSDLLIDFSAGSSALSAFPVWTSMPCTAAGTLSLKWSISRLIESLS